MKLRAVLFDLDGTLLPMDQDLFTKEYFSLLAKKLAPIGYEPGKLVETIWAGTAAMVKNDGSCSNEEAFWRCFAEVYGETALADKPIFDGFYRNEFQQARDVCGYAPGAAETVRLAKALGLRAALATNPIFPAVATESRIRWAGLEPEDFELYTTYENIGHCKPNPEYYRDILKMLGLEAGECLMVGNDAAEDTAAELAGIKVFLLTDCLINKAGRDLTNYPQGDFEQLAQYLKAVCGGA